MHYAIIAAGEGSRLAQEGVARPKPLVELNGEPMILRLINIFTRCNAQSISIIINDFMPEVKDFVKSLQLDVPLNLVIKSTPSSMHSFWELSKVMAPGKFCLTTVDTIFRESEFTSYIDCFQTLVAKDEADGLMGVTDYIDDEKPLYVAADDQLKITGFLDNCENPQYISGGIYGLTPRSLTTLSKCIERGESRMRNFQRALVNDGLRLQAFPFSKVLDVDHASDIQKAEAFLKG